VSYNFTGGSRTTTGGVLAAGTINRWVLLTNTLNPGGETYLTFTLQRKIGVLWTTFARETTQCA
jgi:hypothetical protein